MRRLCPPSILLALLGCGLALAALAADHDAPPPDATGAAGADATQIRTIVFLGDSITAGYGLKKTEAYPAVIQNILTAHNWPWTVVNAGESGDTTKDALARLAGVLGQQRHVDVLVVALGGNDGLRGVAVAELRKNLDAIIGNARFKFPEVKIVLAGMVAPPELGKEYVDNFAAVFPEIAKKDRATLIPFLLEGVAGSEKLNQKDKIHPTAIGQKLVADTVWQVLEPMVRPANSVANAATPEEWDNKPPPPPPVIAPPAPAVPSTAKPAAVPSTGKPAVPSPGKLKPKSTPGVPNLK